MVLRLSPGELVMDLDIFERLALAIAIGAVVGVERHWRERDEAAGARTAGLRTFTLIGMTGGVTGLIAGSTPLSNLSAAILIAVVFAVLSSVIATFHYREQVAEGDFSVTSVIAAMLTFLLGVVALVGDKSVASAGGVVLVTVLASREFLHGFMRRLSWSELKSAIILLAMTFVILPLVPSEPIGPFGGISPANTWILVILLAGISFAGYVAVKILGNRRGELVAGVVGGLVSSTGTTLANARRAAAGTDGLTVAAGALGASSVSCIRTGVLVALLGTTLQWALLPALLTMAAVMIAYALLLARKGSNQHPEQAPKNPFEFDSVLVMVLILVGVGFLARAASAWFGEQGLLVVSLLSGFADVDATTVTVTGMLHMLDADVASTAIAIAVASNTLAKSAYAVAFGSRQFGLHVAGGSAAAVVAGAVAFVLSRAL
jgi:uncharacterized membrane protein (DUF4010 family)